MQNSSLEVEVSFIKEKVTTLEQKVDTILNNHFHDMDMRLTKMETTLSLGHRVMAFGVGIPALLASALSIVTFFSK